MEEDILKNIWSKLKSEKLTESEFDSWQKNITENKDVQVNVHNYLKNNKYTENDFDTWKANTIPTVEQAKINGFTNADPTVEPSTMGSSLENGSLVSFTDPIKKQKKQDIEPAFVESDFGESSIEEEDGGQLIKEAFAKKGLDRDFEILYPSNPFAEKITIKSKVTGKKIDYIWSKLPLGISQYNAGMFKSQRTPISDINNFIYTEGRKNKNNDQDFYKATSVTEDEAIDYVSRPEYFEKSVFKNNINKAKSTAESLIKKLLDYDSIAFEDFKETSYVKLGKDVAEKDKYVDKIYNYLADTHELNNYTELLYLNKDGAKLAISKGLESYVFNKQNEEKIKSNDIIVNTYGSLPEKDVTKILFDKVKKTYSSQINNDPFTLKLIKIQDSIESNQEKLKNPNLDPLLKAEIKSKIEALNKSRNSIDKNFITLADPYTNKIATIKKDNYDENNTSATDITSRVDVYKNLYGNGDNILDAAVSDLGKKTIYNEKLGETVIPFLKLNNLASQLDYENSVKIGNSYYLKNVKYKDVGFYFRSWFGGDLIDEKGNKLDSKVAEYFDRKIDIIAETTAIGELRFLNRSTENQQPSFLESMGDGFIESFAGESYITKREKINLQADLLQNADVDITEGMRKSFVPSFSEDLGTAIGGSVKPILEFAAVDVISGGIAAIPAAARLLKTYNTFKNSNRAWDKIVYYGGQIGWEETKTQLVGLDTGSGAAFKSFHYLAPLKFRNILTPAFEKTGLGNTTSNAAANVFDIAFGGTVRAAGAMETAAFVEAMVKDEKISEYLDENFQGLDQVGRRMIIEGVSMAWLGGKSLFKEQTYWGNKEFQDQLITLDYIEKKKIEAGDTKAAKEIKEAKAAVMSLMVSQNMQKNLAKPEFFKDFMKNDILNNDPIIKQALEDGNTDLEITIDNNINSNGGFGWELYEADGKTRTKLKFTFNANKILEYQNKNKPNAVAYLKNYTTAGHEGAHASSVVEAINNLKKSSPNKSKFSEQEIKEESDKIINKKLNKVVEAFRGLENKVTNFDFKDIRNKVIDAYSKDGYDEIKLKEEIINAVRDKLYRELSYKQRSVLQFNKIAAPVLKALNIKGKVTTANEFFEILDRFSNKKNNKKLENDIDVSDETVNTVILINKAIKAATGEAKPKKINTVEQKSLEDLQADMFDLEDQLYMGEIDSYEYDQKIANIEAKIKAISSYTPEITKEIKQQTDEKSIGQSIKALIPEKLTKVEYDKKYVGDVFEKLTETTMLDGTILNMMARSGIVGEDIYGRTRREFIDEVKGKGESFTLARSIFKFNPEQNDDLGGYIINQIKFRFKSALADFKKMQQENQGLKAEDLKNLEAYKEETNFDDVEFILGKAKEDVEGSDMGIFDKPTLKERGLVNESNMPIVISALKNAMETLSKNEYFNEKSKNKRKVDIISDLLNAVKTDKASQKAFKNSINKKDLFTGNFKDALIENLSTFFLGGKTNGDVVLGGMPFAIEKRVNNEWLKYPDWVGKTIDRESTKEDNAGRTSGNELSRRTSSNSIESLEPAFLKRGSDLSIYDQTLRTAVIQELATALNSRKPTKEQLVIKEKAAKFSENSDILESSASAIITESVIRVLEQRDLDIEISKKVFEKSKDFAEKLFKNNFNTAKTVRDLYKDELTEAQQKQLTRKFNKEYKGFLKIALNKKQTPTEISSAVEKYLKKETLSKKDQEIVDALKSNVTSINKNWVLKKMAVPKLVEKDGKITEEGRLFIAKAYLWAKENIEGKKEAELSDNLRVFNSLFLNPLRYNGVSYKNAESIYNAVVEPNELLKKHFNLKTVNTGKTFDFEGKQTINPTSKESLQDILDKNVIQKNNKEAEANKNIFFKTIKSLKDKGNIIEALEFIGNSFDHLNSIGSLISKIKYIEVDNKNKIIDPKEAVWEHNPPRESIQAKLRAWVLGDVTDAEINSYLEKVEINLISKSADKILRSNGLMSTGTNEVRNNTLIKNNVKLLDISDGVKEPPKSVEQKDLNLDFNKIIEGKFGIEEYKRFSAIVGKRRGTKKGKYRFFIPPSAEDFQGLLYDFLGKGKEGEKTKEWFNETLLTPYNRGILNLEKAKQSIRSSYLDLLKNNKDIKRDLKKLTPDKDYTYDQAIRVYLWTKAGFDIPGLTARDNTKLNDLITNNPKLLDFANKLSSFSQQKEGWIKPSEYWDVETLLSDLSSLTDKAGRKEYLKEFIENSETVFSEENMNKLRAALGNNWVEAMEDSLYRMKNGTNRSYGSNRIVNEWNNWVNNSTGAIMFFNRRSATLQLISATNFLNWSDNNPLKAGAAFANQPQYWKDFAMIFNSAKLKERRSGLKTEVSEAEIANAVKNSKNKAKSVMAYLLKIGFTPTQIADSLAIAGGGSTFYRNRVNTYKKEYIDVNGKLERKYTDKEAETKAFEDFSRISDESQQSSDPSLVSMQQASVLGRLVLAFQNTPQQYMRLTKKAARDLINNRGDWKTNVSKIAYYTAIQNMVFTALQQGLFALLPGFDDEDNADDDVIDKKTFRMMNSMVDTILKGSGLYGAVASTLKNIVLEYNKQEEKGFKADHAQTILQAASISPPIGSKFRKVYSAIQTNKFEKDVISERGFSVISNDRLNLSPAYSAVGASVSGLTNLPLDRIVDEINSLSEAFDDRNTKWQRIALGLGWKTWDVGALNEEHDLIKAGAKEVRKKEGVEKAKKTRALNYATKKETYNNLPQYKKDSISLAKQIAKEKKSKEKFIKDYKESLNLTEEQKSLKKFLENKKRKETSEKSKNTKEKNKKIKDSINFFNRFKK